MHGPAATRPSLLLELRDTGNQQAWDDFVRIYTPLIYGFCCRRGLQDADAADVAQEVLKTVARAVQRFEYDATRGKFRNWLLTVTRNKFNNFISGQHRQAHESGGTSLLQRLEELPSPEEETNWDRDYQRRLFEWASERVRAEVQPKTWQAFWLAAVDGCSGEEVAANLKLSIGAVYVAKSRVTARLRELISSADDGPSDLEGIGK